MNFTDKDCEQLKALGISKSEVEGQLCRFIDGFPELKLSGIVDEGDGINTLSKEEIDSYIKRFDETGSSNRLVKFVPASGAASRMFKLLFNYLEESVTFEDPAIKEYFNGIGKFAFSDELIKLCGESNVKELIDSGDKAVVDLLLSEDGLSYGTLPKALLTFHKYEDGTTTKAIDEHLIEGAQYCSDAEGVVALHFTVSSEHMELIKTHLAKVVPTFEKRFNKRYDISFSIQDRCTDTLAVDMDNNPFRLEGGELLFRPGGHGALLKNLDEIDANIVFIKNIDNVAAEWLLEDTVTFKKVLGGVMLDLEKKVFDFCKLLDSKAELTSELEAQIVDCLNLDLGCKVSDNILEMDSEAKREYFFNLLNRPIRVCGVVKSDSTGGGPFWVKESDGSETLQLVETAQINQENEEQKKILGSSKYANITDLVCGVKNYKGEKFNLMNYRDSDTGFISEKSLSGKSLKAMELPGLWNGAMSSWNTKFVEVPISTFNPVKTVLDLLRAEHQGVK